MSLCRRAVIRVALLLSAMVAPEGVRAAITFQPPVSVPKPLPAAFATADMDQDGRIDLIALGSDGLTVLYGKGDGSFGDRVTMPLGAGMNLAQVDLLAADMNADGAPDLIVPYFGLNRVTIFMNQGHGTFAPGDNYAVGTHPETVAAGDFNRDGKLDLAVANHNGHNMCVLLNRGDGTLLPAVFYGGGSYPGRVLTGDFNGDGNPDLAMSNLVSADASIYLGDGTGRFTGVGSYHANGGYAAEMATDDFNGDGKPDLAVANWHNGTISILAGDGSGAFAAAVNYASNGNPYVTATPDLDGDGDPDLVVVNGEQAHFTVLENHESGNFLPPVAVPREGHGRALAVADFNGDERPDVAVGTLNPDTIAVYLNSSPRPTPAVRSLSLTPAVLTGGCDALGGTVTLTAPAPAGGLTVALSSRSPAVTVPPSVTLQEGETSARFTATAGAVSRAQTGTVLASYQSSGRRAAFRVNPGGSESLALRPRSVIGGAPATGEITLACPADAAGLTVTLATSQGGIAQVPGTVQVSAGASRATFPVQTREVTSATSVVITATVDDRTLAVTLEVRPVPPPPPPPPAVNLLVNGSFELPDTSGSPFGWLWFGAAGLPGRPASAAAIPGWKIPQGTVDVKSWYWPAKDGRQSLDLVGDNPGSIEQSFATTPGQEYVFSGWIAHHPANLYLAEGRANVFLNRGFFFQLVHDDASATLGDMRWQPFSTRFRADTAMTTLLITDATGSPFPGGLVLDGLAVTPVGSPPPAP